MSNEECENIRKILNEAVLQPYISKSKLNMCPYKFKRTFNPPVKYIGARVIVPEIITTVPDDPMLGFADMTKMYRSVMAMDPASDFAQPMLFERQNDMWAPATAAVIPATMEVEYRDAGPDGLLDYLKAMYVFNGNRSSDADMLTLETLRIEKCERKKEEQLRWDLAHMDDDIRIKKYSVKVGEHRILL